MTQKFILIIKWDKVQRTLGRYIPFFIDSETHTFPHFLISDICFNNQWYHDLIGTIFFFLVHKIMVSLMTDRILDYMKRSKCWMNINDQDNDDCRVFLIHSSRSSYHRSVALCKREELNSLSITVDSLIFLWCFISFCVMLFDTLLLGVCTLTIISLLGALIP